MLPNSFFTNSKNKITHERIISDLPYLEELYKKGHTVLCEHLIKMHRLSSSINEQEKITNERINNRNEQEKIINDLTFLHLTSIINSTIKVIIESVEEQIPAGSSHILFLLGVTGSGKTTAMHFLRGDKMIQDGVNYITETNLIDCKIGDSFNSTTFLPHVEKVDALIIVDFPGFAATQGDLIQLATEFAIKALIEKYQPKILFTTPLNDDSKLLKAVMQRIIDLNDIRKCRLAITKYSKDSHYIEIVNYIKKPLSESSEEEQFLSVQVAALQKQPPSESINNMIKQKKERFENIQKDKLRKSQDNYLSVRTDLPDSVKKLDKKQENLLRELDLSQMISFSALEDSPYRHQCLEILMKQQNVRASLKVTLASSHEKLLEKMFNKDIKSKLNSSLLNGEENNYIFNLPEELETHINKYSFMHAIQGQSIGSFCHLPQMDPTLIQKFDAMLIDYLLTNYIHSIIHLNIPFIKEVIKSHFSLLLTQFVRALTNLENLTQSICGIFGNESERNKEWIKQHQLFYFTDFDAFAMPKWIKSITFFRAKHPVQLSSLSQNALKDPQDALKNLNDALIEQCIMEIDVIRHNLAAWKNINKMVTNSNENKKTQQLSIASKKASQLLFQDSSTKQKKLAKVIIPPLDLTKLRKKM